MPIIADVTSSTVQTSGGNSSSTMGEVAEAAFGAVQNGGSVTALQGGGAWATADENGAAFGGVEAITFGTTFTAGRSVAFICTVSGDVDLTFADGTEWNSYPIQAAAGSVQTLPYALTKMAPSNASPATLTAWVLK